MATSGTATFSMDFSEVLEEAYEQAGKVAGSGYDVLSARRSLNLLFQEWANRGVNLWTVNEQTQVLTANDPTYTLAADTVSVIDCAIRTGTGTSQVDRNMTRLSVAQWANQSNKNTTGPPQNFYIDRQSAAPVVTLWPVPDSVTTYTLVYWRLRRIEDAGNSGNIDMDMPHRFLPALTAGLAFRIAAKDPQLANRVAALKDEYEFQWGLAADEDRDRSSFHLAPDLSAQNRI